MPAAPAEGAAWEQAAAGWERGRRLLFESTRPVSEWLVDRLAPQPGEEILELAAGTGETGFLAAARIEPGGRLISSDRAEAMVAAAGRLAASLGLHNVEFRPLDASSIALPDASIDGAISRFGYILRGNPPPALRELRRVLRPSGRLVFSVWAERGRNAWMTVPSEVMVELGHIAAPDASERELSARRNPETIARLLHAAGFTAAQIEELPVSYRFADADELWLFARELRGPLSLAIERLPEGALTEVRAALLERTPRTSEGGYELAGVSINVLARTEQAPVRSDH